MAFTRVSDKPIRVKSEVRTPHYVLVLDPSLLKTIDVTAGLRNGGLMLVNGPPEMKMKEQSGFTTLVFDATSVSLNYGLGSRMSPIVNTALLGAFSAAVGLVKVESLEKSIPEFVPRKTKANIDACRDAYQKMREEMVAVES